MPPGFEDGLTGDFARCLHSSSAMNSDAQVFQMPTSAENGMVTIAEFAARFNGVSTPSTSAMNPDAKIFEMPTPAAEENRAADDLLPVGCVTVMLRNIPNKFTREVLASRLWDAGFKGDVDFLYLPIDFKNRCNVGYCFLSFTTPEATSRFAREFHGEMAKKKLPGFNSNKVCEVSPARVQGKNANICRLQASPLMSQLADKREWLPILFDDQGNAMDFPVPEESARAQVSRRRQRNANVALQRAAQAEDE
jgi:hypothetical protein